MHVETEEALELVHGRPKPPIEAEAQQLKLGLGKRSQRDGFGSSPEIRHVRHEKVLRAELRQAQDAPLRRFDAWSELVVVLSR